MHMWANEMKDVAARRLGGLVWEEIGLVRGVAPANDWVDNFASEACGESVRVEMNDVAVMREAMQLLRRSNWMWLQQEAPNNWAAKTTREEVGGFGEHKYAMPVVRAPPTEPHKVVSYGVWRQALVWLWTIRITT